METNLKFNSAICTSREQSERLLSLGLKAETADMRYQIFYLDLGGVLKECTPSLEPYPPLNNDRFIPAWSLHRLIEILNNWGIDFSIKGKADPYEYVISIIEGHVIKKAIDRVLRIMEEE